MLPFLLAPTTVVVGVDGILVRWLWVREFVATKDIIHVRRFDTGHGRSRRRGVEIYLPGRTVQIPMYSDEAIATLETRINDVIKLQRSSAHVEQGALLLSRGELEWRDWIARLKAVGDGRNGDAPHRRGSARAALARRRRRRATRADARSGRRRPRIIGSRSARRGREDDRRAQAPRRARARGVRGERRRNGRSAARSRGLETSPLDARPIAERLDVAVAEELVGLIHRGLEEAHRAVRIGAVGRGVVRERRRRQAEVVLDDRGAIGERTGRVRDAVDVAHLGSSIFAPIVRAMMCAPSGVTW